MTCAAVLVAAAPAAAKPGHRDGFRIDWPLKRATTTVAPGAALTVTVRRTGHRAGTAPRVTVSLVRLSRSGRPLQRVATRRAREGRLTVRVPKGAGRLYELRLVLGALRQSGRVRTPAPPPAATPAPVAPAPTDPKPVDPTPMSVCAATAGGPLAAELRLDAPGVPLHAGDRFGYTIADTGTTCLLTGYGVRWERRADDGTWTAWPTFDPAPAIAIIVLPGHGFATAARVPPDATPGHYRVSASVDAEPRLGPPGPPPPPYVPDLWVSAEVDVVAP